MTGIAGGRQVEGWDWVRIQQQACPQSGQCAAAVAPARLGRLRDNTEEFTVAGLARFALHEAQHHPPDATGALGQ